MKNYSTIKISETPRKNTHFKSKATPNVSYFAKLICAKTKTSLTSFKNLTTSVYESAKHQPLADIIFAICFFAIIFVPMLNISDAKKSIQENRVLATFKPVFANKKINLNFGKDFDAWFGDRFFGRKQLLDLKRTLFPVGNTKVLIGEDGWLFIKIDNSVENYANKTDLSEKDLQRGLTYLKNLNNQCNKHNKKFYFIIAPDKNKIYGEKIKQIRKQRDDSHGIGFQFYNYIKENSDVNVIYLYDTLYNNKNKELLYHKTDTHWNYYGAYIGYKEIEKQILKDFSFEPVVIKNWEPYTRLGDLEKMLGYTTTQDKTIYKRPKTALNNSCDIISKYLRKDGIITCYNNSAPLNKNAFILRDSFSTKLRVYYEILFNKFTMHRNVLVGKDDLKEIEQNYDIVILESAERYIPNILKLSFPKD